MNPTFLELFQKKFNKKLPLSVVYKNMIFFLRDTVPDDALEAQDSVKWLDLKNNSGRDIYRRSLAFLLRKTIFDLYSNTRLAIGHSLSGGFYFDLYADVPVRESLLNEIREKLDEQVQQNLPIEKSEMSLDEAISLFQKMGCPDKVRLLKQLDFEKVSLYKCEDFYDLDHGVFVHETGQLNIYDLITRAPGFILRFPRTDSAELIEIEHQHKLFKIYRESQTWNNILEISNLGRLNQKIQDGTIFEFIKIDEALHERKLVLIATEIAKVMDRVRLILISGPSASGKTTFAKRLGIQLKVLGIRPKTMSLDNYFGPRLQCPKDEKGEWDFEHIDALDRPLLNKHLQEILSGHQVEMPIYDFETGDRKDKTIPFRLEPDEMLVLEGIHALNPKLTYSVSNDLKFMIYVSCLTQITVDEGNRISTTATRLLRRIVRDQKFRNYSASETINRWPSIQRGERNNIFPYQENAHEMVNSALSYELAVFKMIATPLLKKIDREDKSFIIARMLLHTLNHILPLTDFKDIPPNSILREFIGESSFKY
ncbi:nucleoside kinase [Candidatus Riflebacteria bacterium]